MAENKKSFILYCDILATFENLTDEEAGKLTKHLLRYVNDLNPEPVDRVTGLLFEPIKQQLKRDLVKWSEKSAKRSEIGRLGGLKSGETRAKQKEANEAIASKNQANEPVNVSVNVNDNNIKEIIEYLNQKTQKKLSPKTKETVRHLTARLKTYTVEDAKKVIDIKVDEWMGTEWEKYLVPDTLFSESNFEKYLNQKPSIKKEVCPYTPEQIKKFRANLQGFGSAGKDFDMKWIKELQ